MQQDILGKGSPQSSDTNTPILGDALGKKVFSAAKDHFPWEGPAFRNFPPSERPCNPSLQNFKLTSRRHLTAWAVSTNVPTPLPSGTWMGNSYPTYPPFPFSKGYTLNFKSFKRDTLWYSLVVCESTDLRDLWVAQHCSTLQFALQPFRSGQDTVTGDPAVKSIFSWAEHKGTIWSQSYTLPEGFFCHQGSDSSFV